MELTEKKENGIIIITISGRLDVTNSEIVEKKFIETIESGETKIVVDCENLHYISSSGLRAFLLLVKKLNTMNGKCIISSLQPDIKEIFDISGFSSIFIIADNKQDALKAISTQ